MELFVKKITKTEVKENGAITEKFSTALEDVEETMIVTVKEIVNCTFDIGDKFLFDKIESQSKLKK